MNQQEKDSNIQITNIKWVSINLYFCNFCTQTETYGKTGIRYITKRINHDSHNTLFTRY